MVCCWRQWLHTLLKLKVILAGPEQESEEGEAETEGKDADADPGECV